MTSQRTAKAILNRTFARSESAIVLFDGKQKLVFANAAAEVLLGFSIEELSKVTGAYHHLETGDPVSDAVSRVCPPPELFSGQAVHGSRKYFAESPANNLSIQYFRLAQEGEGTMVIGLMIPDQLDVEEAPNYESKLVEALENVNQLREQQFSLEHFIGESSASKQVLSKSDAAITSGANILVFGPQGSGREHLARSIHRAWRNKHGISSESGILVTLDGVTADAERVQAAIRGLFHAQEDVDQTQARVLLLNADQLEINAQHELLNILNLRDFDIGVLSTAAQPLNDHPQFESALAAMLSTVEIEMPALASRLEDIPIVAQFFVEQFNRNHSQQFSGFTETAMDQLIQYYWPGNVDELAEVIRYACENCTHSKIDVVHLPKKIGHALLKEEHPETPQTQIELDKFLQQVESELIARAMKKAKGNKSKAAELLGINRARLIRRLQQSEPEDN